MKKILEGILKGLLQWMYGLILEIVEYIANNLLDVFSMDLKYFESSIPVADEIMTIIIAAGWALLLGNLILQASKSMMSGLGFEAEDPKTLFARTFVFAFFLLASRQICDIGLGISNTVITLLQVPDSVSVNIPGESIFTIGASWLLVIIAGFVLMWQIVKLFFAIGERYFLVGLLTLLSPWAFAMGGSRNTSDIFKGWARMYGSMCLMMILNVICLKMLLSVMGNMPAEAGIAPWIIFQVAITRATRKIDTLVMRIGLNPVPAGGQGRGLPGVLSYMVLKSVSSNVIQAAGGSAGNAKKPQNGAANKTGASRHESGSRQYNRTNTNNRNASQNKSETNSSSSSASSQRTEAGAAGTPPNNPAAQGLSQNSGVAGTAQAGSTTAVKGATGPGVAGTQATARVAEAQGSATNHQAGGVNTTGIHTGNTAVQQTSNSQNNSSRRTSASHQNNARASALRTGAAGMPGNNHPPLAGGSKPLHPPLQRSGQPEKPASADRVTTVPPEGMEAQQPARFSAVPANMRNSLDRRNTSGAAGIGSTSSTARIQQGGMNIGADNRSTISSAVSQSASGAAGSDTIRNSVSGSLAPPSGSHAISDSRKTTASPDKPQATAGNAPIKPATPVVSASQGYAGMGSRRNAPSTAANPVNTAGAQSFNTQTSGVNQPPVSQSSQSQNGNPSGRQERGIPHTAANPAVAGTPTSGSERFTHTVTPAPTKPGVYMPKPPNTGRSPSRITGISNLLKPMQKKEKKKNRKGKGKPL